MSVIPPPQWAPNREGRGSSDEWPSAGMEGQAPTCDGRAAPIDGRSLHTLCGLPPGLEAELESKCGQAELCGH